VVDLFRSVGAIFFVLSATSPLLQAWFAQSGSRRNPYPLFAASNLGSLIGLLAFPFIVEPWLPLSAQGSWLTIASAAVMILVCASGLACWRTRACGTPATVEAVGLERPTSPPVSAPPQAGLWLLLSMCPCMLLMGTTVHLTSEIAPMPLLWIVPLALYLASFVVAFSHNRYSAAVTRWAGPLFVVCALVIAWRVFLQRHEAIDLLLHCLLLATGATALHGQLAATRPDAKRLTEYYTVISLGGLVGSGFCALVAPLLFNWQAEYPLAIVATLASIKITRTSAATRWIYSSACCSATSAAYLRNLPSCSRMARGSTAAACAPKLRPARASVSALSLWPPFLLGPRPKRA
jgi:hypothetical protein